MCVFQTLKLRKGEDWEKFVMRMRKCLYIRDAWLISTVMRKEWVCTEVLGSEWEIADFLFPSTDPCFFFPQVRYVPVNIGGRIILDF